MASQQIACPNCGDIAPAFNINIRAVICKCEGCHRVFSISATLSSAAAAVVPEKPGSLAYESELAGKMSIKRHWHDNADLGLLLFGFLWTAFFLFFWRLASSDREFPVPDWIPFSGVAAGMGILYLAAGRFVNSTLISVDQQSLVVHHGPLPWVGNRILKATDITQIELVYQAITGGREVSTAIWANHSNGRRIRLLDLKNHREAEYIAWHLADALKCELLR